MPYQHVDNESDWVDEDDDALSPDVISRPATAFEYEPVEGTFEPDELDGPAAVIYAALVDAGAKRFRVRYDGGHDEGFAHADGGRTADGVDWPFDRLLAAVAAAGPIDALRATFGSGAPNPRTGRVPYYATVSPEQLIELALDHLGDDMVSCLLGNGYGTGEHSIYGAITADLTTGMLVDEPSVPQPPEATFD